MKRLLFLSFLIVTPVHAETAISLKENVSVAADKITLNDLLTAPVTEGRVELFASPAPGESGVIQAARVIEAAKNYGLTYIAEPAWREINISREARLVKREELEKLISRKAAEQLRADENDIELTISHLPAEIKTEKTDTALQFANFTLALQSGNFEARLFLPGSKLITEASPLIVSGMLHRMADVVKVKNNVERGANITINDVELVRIKHNQLAANAVRDVADIQGMVAKRSLSEDTFLRSSDLAKAKLVSRNEMVLILYETPAMTVTTRGKALMDGAMGEVIEIQNMASKRNVTATVIGNNKVIVSVASQHRVAGLSTTTSNQK